MRTASRHNAWASALLPYAAPAYNDHKMPLHGCAQPPVDGLNKGWKPRDRLWIGTIPEDVSWNSGSASLGAA